MAGEEISRAQIMAKLEHVDQSVNRVEKRFDKDSEDLFERVRKLEVDIALAQQAHTSWKSQCKRDFALVAGVVGTGGGAIATAVVKLIGG